MAVADTRLLWVYTIPRYYAHRSSKSSSSKTRQRLVAGLARYNRESHIKNLRPECASATYELLYDGRGCRKGSGSHELAVAIGRVLMLRSHEAAALSLGRKALQRLCYTGWVRVDTHRSCGVIDLAKVFHLPDSEGHAAVHHSAVRREQHIDGLLQQHATKRLKQSAIGIAT